MKLWRYFQQLVLYLNKFWSFFYRDRIQLQDSVCSNFQRYTDYLVLNLLTCSQKSFLPNTHFHRWGNIYKKIWIVILLVYCFIFAGLLYFFSGTRSKTPLPSLAVCLIVKSSSKAEYVIRKGFCRAKQSS